MTPTKPANQHEAPKQEISMAKSTLNSKAPNSKTSKDKEAKPSPTQQPNGAKLTPRQQPNVASRSKHFNASANSFN